jgi:hypothetical protein
MRCGWPPGGNVPDNEALSADEVGNKMECMASSFVSSLIDRLSNRTL